MFDLDSHVTDIAWAPYSSTVFAASTLDGRVHVFDLKLDKYHAICSQKVTITKHTGLNHLSFNLQYPVLNVGDTKYVLYDFKSPFATFASKARQ